jgi:hypothetical protein
MRNFSVTSAKAGDKLRKWLTRNFVLQRKQEGNERVDHGSHWLAMGQNKTIWAPI